MNWLRGKPENDKGRAQLVIAMLDKVIRLKGDINGGGRLRYKLFTCSTMTTLLVIGIATAVGVGK